MMWKKLKKFKKKNEQGWEGVKEEIETINVGEYWKDLKKIGLNLIMRANE